MGTIAGQCTITRMALRYPHGEQAEPDSAAVMTYVELEKAETETVARQISIAMVIPGDYRGVVQEGQMVVVSVTS